MFSKADLNSGLFQGLQVQVVVHKHEIKGVSFPSIFREILLMCHDDWEFE